MRLYSAVYLLVLAYVPPRFHLPTAYIIDLAWHRAPHGDGTAPLVSLVRPVTTRAAAAPLHRICVLPDLGCQSPSGQRTPPPPWIAHALALCPGSVRHVQTDAHLRCRRGARTAIRCLDSIGNAPHLSPRSRLQPWCSSTDSLHLPLGQPHPAWAESARWEPARSARERLEGAHAP